jgi:hypothetical protein
MAKMTGKMEEQNRARAREPRDAMRQAPAGSKEHLGKESTAEGQAAQGGKSGNPLKHAVTHLDGLNARQSKSDWKG